MVEGSVEDQFEMEEIAQEIIKNLEAARVGARNFDNTVLRIGNEIIRAYARFIAAVDPILSKRWERKEYRIYGGTRAEENLAVLNPESTLLRVPSGYIRFRLAKNEYTTGWITANEYNHDRWQVAMFFAFIPDINASLQYVEKLLSDEEAAFTQDLLALKEAVDKAVAEMKR